MDYAVKILIFMFLFYKQANIRIGKLLIFGNFLIKLLSCKNLA